MMINYLGHQTRFTLGKMIVSIMIDNADHMKKKCFVWVLKFIDIAHCVGRFLLVLYTKVSVKIAITIYRNFKWAIVYGRRF